MNELTTGQILDEILRLCLKNKDSFYNENGLIKVLFPEYVKDEMTVFFEKIKYSPYKVADIEIGRNTSSIQANGLTEKFLEQGGFTEIENKGLILEQRQEEKEFIEFEKSKIDFELSKETLKEFPKTKRRAKVAYIIAIVLAFTQITQWIIKLLS